MSDGSAPMPYTEADVALVAGLLPGLIAMEHGCLPGDCDLTEDTDAGGWLNIAKNVVARLAAAGRLLPEGAELIEHWGVQLPREKHIVDYQVREVPARRTATVANGPLMHRYVTPWRTFQDQGSTDE